jgi:hypothetical protein
MKLTLKEGAQLIRNRTSLSMSLSKFKQVLYKEGLLTRYGAITIEGERWLTMEKSSKGITESKIFVDSAYVEKFLRNGPEFLFDLGLSDFNVNIKELSADFVSPHRTSARAPQTEASPPQESSSRSSDTIFTGWTPPSAREGTVRAGPQAPANNGEDNPWTFRAFKDDQTVFEFKV